MTKRTSIWIIGAILIVTFIASITVLFCALLVPPQKPVAELYGATLNGVLKNGMQGEYDYFKCVDLGKFDLKGNTEILPEGSNFYTTKIYYKTDKELKDCFRAELWYNEYLLLQENNRSDYKNAYAKVDNLTADLSYNAKKRTLSVLKIFFDEIIMYEMNTFSRFDSKGLVFENTLILYIPEGVSVNSWRAFSFSEIS